MRSVIPRKISNLYQKRNCCGPSEKYGVLSGKARQLIQHTAEIVWHQSANQFLISVVHDPMQKKCVALGQHCWRDL